jgi:hypothetical protein
MRYVSLVIVKAHPAEPAATGRIRAAAMTLEGLQCPLLAGVARKR